MTADTPARCWLDDALRYAALGWRLVPLHAREKRPRHEAWQRAATSNTEILERWAEQWPDANLGLKLGPDSKVVDVETDGDEGEQGLALLAGDDGLPITPTYQSTRGKHRLFKWSADLPCADKSVFKLFNKKLEFRTGNGGKGAQSALPPSIHPTGAVYKWLLSPDDVPVAEIPPEMMARICLAVIEGEDALRPKQHTANGMSVAERAWRYIDQIPRSVSGQNGHDRCFEAACRLVVGFGLKAGEAAGLLDRWNAGCNPPWSDKELEHKIKQAEQQAVKETGRVGELLGSPRNQYRKYERPEIVIGPDERRVNDESLTALAASVQASRVKIFQRYGLLVRVIRKADAPPSMKFAEGESIKISPIVYATLREILADAAAFKKENAKGDLVSARVPRDCVEAILARKEWPGIPALTGIVPGPVLRPDGSILSAPGYDQATGLLVDDHGLTVSVPDRPTQDDARRAAELLAGVFVDFPFEKIHHRSAAIAAVLSHLARWFIQDSAPLFLIDANLAGTGKGLLADVIICLATGAPRTARMATPGTDEEWRKQITSAVIAGISTLR